MDPVLMQFQDLGMGLVLGLSACGSGAGAGVAGMAAIGAWKKKFSQNKPASFMLLAFVGAPLTQTIYGMIVMNRMYDDKTDYMEALELNNRVTLYFDRAMLAVLKGYMEMMNRQLR